VQQFGRALDRSGLHDVAKNFHLAQIHGIDERLTKGYQRTPRIQFTQRARRPTMAWRSIHPRRQT
jgi:hypothetical protein